MAPTTHLANIVYLKNLIAMHVPRETVEALRGGGSQTKKIAPIVSESREMSRIGFLAASCLCR